MGKYKYVLDQDYQYQLGVTIEKPFEGIDKKGVKRMSITTDGLLNIYAGYAWDGATAVPDFKGTYYAALVHDALYQFLPHTPLTRKQIDEIFLRQMR